jgi:prophage regulatory protein
MTKPVQQTLLDDGDARMCVDRCRVYRVKELASLINLHPITIWRWQATGRLPKPIKLGPNTTVWRASDIAAWLDQKAQEPQQRLTAPDARDAAPIPRTQRRRWKSDSA